MPLATLSIDLEARLAKFEADLGRASRSLDKLAENARGSFARVGEVFAGSFAASAVEEGLRGLVELFPQLVEGVAALQDLSEETGASTVALASFQTAADVSGVKIDQLAQLMVRLTGNLGRISTETKGAGQALSNLGIPLEEFRRLAPDQQIQKLSIAFNTFEDGASKTSNALALFGRQGPSVLRFFKEYGDGLESSSRLTAEQIARADEYGDRQARMRSELRQTAQAIAIQALPALTALGNGFRTGALQILNLQGAAGDLRADTAILDFAEGGAVAVATLAESLVGVIKLANALRGSFQVVAADVSFALQAKNALLQMGPDQKVGATADIIGKLLDQRNATVAEANARYVDLWTYNGTAVTDAIRKSFAEQRRLLNDEDRREAQRMRERASTLAGGKPALASVTLPDDSGKSAESTFARLMQQIQQRQEIAQEELNSGQKISETDRLRIDVLKQLTLAEQKLTPAMEERVRAALAGALVVVKANEDQNERLKLTQAETRAIAQLATAQDEANRKLAEQLDEIGLTADQVERLRITRLAATLAQRQEAAVTLQLMGLQGDELAQRQLLNDGLAREIQLRGQVLDKKNAIATSPLAGANSALDEYFKKVDEAGTATKSAVTSTIDSLESGLSTGLAQGKFEVRGFVNSVIAEIYRLQVVRPLLKSIFSTGDSGSFFASLFGSSSGSSGGSAGVITGGSGLTAAYPLATGTDYVPYDNFPALLHKGERVTPARFNPAAGGGTGGSITQVNNFTINGATDADAVQRQIDRALQANNGQLMRSQAYGGSPRA